MKAFYDICFTTNEQYQFLHVQYGDIYIENTYAPLFKNWISYQRHITSVFPVAEEDTSGEFVWDGDSFSYERMDAPNQGFYYFLVKQNHLEDLLIQTLNLITDGVQIYDENGYALFFNQASRKLSQIPPTLDIRGRHLLDLFALDEQISTTMTALRTKSPVINRVDNFSTSAGVSIASVNTSYPVSKDNELIGAIVFEQTQNIIDCSKEKMAQAEKALRDFQPNTPPTRFSGYTFEHIIGNGKNLQKAVRIARKIAPQNNSVLLVGETGTGKEIFAQSIHRCSPRKDKKFVALNCAAIPETLIESLLFGTQKGSFTGSENKAGYFEEAEGGTLFLDEMNSMSLAMQSKILRALQENSFRRVGGQKDISMDVRIISSCNKDPFLCIKENELRKDLFYRLSTVMIELPPLRNHKEDLEELIQYHLRSTVFQYVHSSTEISPEVMELFYHYDWPGNVRELFHVLDYVRNISDGNTILLEHLPSYLLKTKKASETLKKVPDTFCSFQNTSLQNMMDEYEHEILCSALEHFGYNITKTADALGIRRQSLQYRIHKYGIHI